MKLKDLRAVTRELLDDVTGPYLWSNDTLNRFLNNAVREACIRARLLKDDPDTQPKLCVISFDAGQRLVKYDPSILVVRSGYLTNQPHKLWAMTADSMDRYEPCWNSDNESPSCPRYLVMDIAQKVMRLYPTPDVAGTLNLRVWRVPGESERMAKDDDVPAIQLPDMEELKHWAAHEAYMIKDTETFDPQRSANELAVFESRFGERPTLHAMARWADSPPRVRYAHTF